MSRQLVTNRRGKMIGYIDTARDGQQVAICKGGVLLGIFNPVTHETMAPSGAMLSEGNLLADLLRRQA